MKIKLVTAVGGLALILVIILAGLRACKLTDQLSVLEGQHQELTREKDALDKAHLKLEIETERVIAAKDAEIKRILESAGQPTPAEIEKDATIAAQQKQIAALEAQGDIAGALRTAKAEIEAWDSKFTLAEKRHADDLKALDAAWGEKFNAQVKLTDSWKARYEAEARLHEISRQELGIMARKLSAARFTGTLKSGLVVLAGGYLAYQAIKGTK